MLFQGRQPFVFWELGGRLVQAVIEKRQELAEREAQQKGRGNPAGLGAGRMLKHRMRARAGVVTQFQQQGGTYESNNEQAETALS